MPIVTESLGSGLGTLYEDESGGDVVIAISHPDYLSNHRFRVIPFSTDGLGNYTSPPSGTVTSIHAEMENLATLLADLYFTDTSGAFVAVNQVLSDHTGTQPYPYAFVSSDGFSAGTLAGASEARWIVVDLIMRGTDGSKWRLELPGTGTNLAIPITRIGSVALASTRITNLVNYLTGASNGPTVAAKTNVVTHSGARLAAPAFVLHFPNKRLRRHFKVS